ncbi:MAG: hypothetical protein ACRCZS_13270 [Chroococcidiopsis sp.]
MLQPIKHSAFGVSVWINSVAVCEVKHTTIIAFLGRFIYLLTNQYVGDSSYISSPVEPAAQHHRRYNRRRPPIHPNAHLGTGRAWGFRRLAKTLSITEEEVKAIALKLSEFGKKFQLQITSTKTRPINQSQK